MALDDTHRKAWSAMCENKSVWISGGWDRDSGARGHALWHRIGSGLWCLGRTSDAGKRITRNARSDSNAWIIKHALSVCGRSGFQKVLNKKNILKNRDLILVVFALADPTV